MCPEPSTEDDLNLQWHLLYGEPNADRTGRKWIMPTPFEWLQICVWTWAAQCSLVATIMGNDPFRTGVLGAFLATLAGTPIYLLWVYRGSR